MPGEENASEQARILHNQTRWGVKLHRPETAPGDFNIPWREKGTKCRRDLVFNVSLSDTL